MSTENIPLPPGNQPESMAVDPTAAVPHHGLDRQPLAGINTSGPGQQTASTFALHQPGVPVNYQARQPASLVTGLFSLQPQATARHEAPAPAAAVPFPGQPAPHEIDFGSFSPPRALPTAGEFSEYRYFHHC